MDAAANKSTLYYRGSCIVKRQTYAQFDQAKIMCDDFDQTKYKGHLVHLLDEEIIKTVRDRFSVYTAILFSCICRMLCLQMTVGEVEFIGLTQKQPAIEPAGSWYWVDGQGELMWSSDGHTTGQWQPGQPDNYNGADSCVFVHYHTLGELKLLVDTSCSKTEWFICQYRKTFHFISFTFTKYFGL